MLGRSSCSYDKRQQGVLVRRHRHDVQANPARQWLLAKMVDSMPWECLMVLPRTAPYFSIDLEHLEPDQDAHRLANIDDRATPSPQVVELGRSLSTVMVGQYSLKFCRNAFWPGNGDPPPMRTCLL